MVPPQAPSFFACRWQTLVSLRPSESAFGGGAAAQGGLLLLASLATPDEAGIEPSSRSWNPHPPFVLSETNAATSLICCSVS
jgi:hypothetical protein